MFRLLVTEKGGDTKQLVFEKDEISIGRVQGNDIVLPKGNISKRHSKLTFRDGQLAVADLKSTNGTYVNGRKIADTTPITAADKIYVGDFVITLDEPDVEEAEAAPPPRRAPLAPPPPPPPRAQAKAPPAPARAARPLEDEDDGDESLNLGAPAARAPGRLPAPPPPPPPPRREMLDLGGDEDESAPAPEEALPPPPEDIGLGDDEPLAAAPPRRPTGPARQVSLVADDEEDIEALPSSNARARPAAPAVPARGVADATSVPVGDDEPAPAVTAGSLQELIDDGSVTAIFIAGPDAVHVERDGRTEAASVSLGGAEGLAEMIRQMGAMCTPPPPEGAVTFDVRLPGGGRLCAVLPPLAPNGACATIRKPFQGGRSLADLVAGGGASKEIQQLLEACVAGHRNLLCSGDPSATTVLIGALASTVAPDARVVSVSSRGEMALPLPGWVNLVSSADSSGVVRAAAALRPAYLVAPDAGAAEAGELLAAAAAGQEGLLVGIGARSAGEALARFEALGALAGAKDLLPTIFDLVVHVTTGVDGGVRVLEVADIKTGSDGKLAAEAVMSWKGEGGGSGKHVATGVTPRVAGALAARGAALPAGLFRR